MHPSRQNSNILLILILTALLSAFVSPSLALPAPSPPTTWRSTSDNHNIGVYRRHGEPAPKGHASTGKPLKPHKVTGCKHASAECRGTGERRDSAYCSYGGTYIFANTPDPKSCQNAGCKCEVDHGKTIFEMMGL